MIVDRDRERRLASGGGELTSAGGPPGQWGASLRQAPTSLPHQPRQHRPDVPQVLLLFGGPRQVDELLHSAS